MPNEHSNTPPEGQQPQTIPLSEIHDLPGVFNPKPVESKLGSMIISIQNSGVMEPVILRQRDDGECRHLRRGTPQHFPVLWGRPQFPAHRRRDQDHDHQPALESRGL